MSRAESVFGAGDEAIEQQSSRVDQASRMGVKFDPVHSGLPLALESQCLFCERVLAAEMKRVDGRVVILKSCPQHLPLAAERTSALVATKILPLNKTPCFVKVILTNGLRDLSPDGRRCVRLEILLWSAQPLDEDEMVR